MQLDSQFANAFRLLFALIVSLTNWRFWWSCSHFLHWGSINNLPAIATHEQRLPSASDYSRPAPILSCENPIIRVHTKNGFATSELPFECGFILERHEFTTGKNRRRQLQQMRSQSFDSINSRPLELRIRTGTCPIWQPLLAARTGHAIGR